MKKLMKHSSYGLANKGKEKYNLKANATGKGIFFQKRVKRRREWFYWEYRMAREVEEEIRYLTTWMCGKECYANSEIMVLWQNV